MFTVDGTAYVPLRAVAELCGMEVGFNASRQTVMLNTQAAQTTSTNAFASHWELKEKPVTNYGSSRAAGEFTVCNFDVAGARIK